VPNLIVCKNKRTFGKTNVYMLAMLSKNYV